MEAMSILTRTLPCIGSGVGTSRHSTTPKDATTAARTRSTFPNDLKPGLVGKEGLEPSRPLGHMILNHARLPFRHFPIVIAYHSPSGGGADDSLLALGGRLAAEAHHADRVDP